MGSLAVRVSLPAVSNTRLLKVAIPPVAATVAVLDPEKPPGPAAVSVTLELSLVTRLPKLSSSSTATGLSGWPAVPVVGKETNASWVAGAGFTVIATLAVPVRPSPGSVNDSWRVSGPLYGVFGV